jgi:hypothetical protein
MSKRKIALEGVINACQDAECKDWREGVIRDICKWYDFHNPMDFDCRGREAEMEQELIDLDTRGIASSDIILVMAERPGWGTAMGVQMAWAMHKYIITVCPSDKPSPWLKNRSGLMFKTLADAVDFLGTAATGRSDWRAA